VVLRFQDARRLNEDASAIYRRKHGLLSADQIRSIRDLPGSIEYLRRHAA
jgi:hypothetical protein